MVAPRCARRRLISRRLAVIPNRERTMKRLHVHIAVDNLEKSIGFYSTLFAALPSVIKPDYTKWMLDDPKVNFAISARGTRADGVDHLGIQVETDSELRELADRLKVAGETTRDLEATTCCCAQSNKAWVNDPSGICCETFFTFGEATTYGEDEPTVIKESQSACGAKASCCRCVMIRPSNLTMCCFSAQEIQHVRYWAKPSSTRSAKASSLRILPGRSRKARCPRSRLRCSKGSAFQRKGFARRVGMSSRNPERRCWISSSRFATTLPTKFVRSGPANP